MPVFDPQRIDRLKAEWTDKLVTINPAKPDLKRFEGLIGRVVTVNFGGKALVDFADGAWYDIPADADHLTVAGDDAESKYNAEINSAQPFPARQG